MVPDLFVGLLFPIRTIIIRTVFRSKQCYNELYHPADN